MSRPKTGWRLIQNVKCNYCAFYYTWKGCTQHPIMDDSDEVPELPQLEIADNQATAGEVAEIADNGPVRNDEDLESDSIKNKYVVYFIKLHRKYFLCHAFVYLFIRCFRITKFCLHFFFYEIQTFWIIRFYFELRAYRIQKKLQSFVNVLHQIGTSAAEFCHQNT